VDDGDSCPYLTINEDDTTTCSNENAISAFVDGGIGCLFQSEGADVLYDLQLELGNVTERKRMIREAQ
jgi:hypothetical protein